MYAWIRSTPGPARSPGEPLSRLMKNKKSEQSSQEDHHNHRVVRVDKKGQTDGGSVSVVKSKFKENILCNIVCIIKSCCTFAIIILFIYNCCYNSNCIVTITLF